MIADIDAIAGDDYRISTRVKLEPGKYVVLFQTGLGDKGGDARDLLYFIVRAELDSTD